MSMSLGMTYSEKGLKRTQEFESCSLVAYPDPATKNDPDPLKRGKPWTIGWGHTKGVYPGMTCTQEQADLWLLEDLSFAIRTVNELVKVPLTQNQFDVLVDFVFNVGRANFIKSELLEKLNKGGYSEVDAELLEWIYANGKVMKGLIRRREAGAAAFEDEEPDSI